MRICINAAAANQGGAVTYLLNLLPRLAERPEDDRFLVIAPHETLDRLGEVLAHEKFEAEPYPHPPSRFLRRVVFDQLDVPRAARRFRADLLYSSNGFGSFVHGRAEALLVRNSIYFSRDLEARLRGLGRSLRDLRLRRTMSVLSMRTASAVLFPTRAMARRVGEWVRLDRKPTRAIHYGFDADRFFGDDAPGDDVLGPMRAWRARGRRVLLYVSGYAVHKNFETAIEALARLLEDGVDAGLVLTAEWKPFGEMAEFEALTARARELGLEDHLHWPGQIPWPQLHALHAEADVHWWPTLLESFGHPMLEAMASGLPTVAADTEVNREILADAAVYFPPLDPVGFARATRSVLDEPAVAEGLVRAAADRIGAFTWSAHAAGLRTFFGQVAGGADATRPPRPRSAPDQSAP